MPLLYHAYVYLEFLILACTIYILAPRVFTAKCSEPQVGTSNGMDEGSGVTKFLSLRTET